MKITCSVNWGLKNLNSRLKLISQFLKNNRVPINNKSSQAIVLKEWDDEKATILACCSEPDQNMNIS